MNSLDVVAAIIRDGDHVLACRRREGKASAGFWEFPGGKIETAETPEQALQREIVEELGVSILVGEVATVDTTTTPSAVIRLHCYFATLWGERPTSSTDHDELRWLLPSDLSSLIWATPDLPAVRLLGSAT
ncbi:MULTISPECIES: (deoxy)nucleoside triphosphate pyrophosphohydrolase [unclassified Rathayibacter]|uniref:(deoxy)nucleoside triphosphate pyrophosphohydrolase n=1 Tax=unclassified Rathayibacter TaxID=2609250 RepID=UPI0007005A4C|nr:MULTISPECIES: (deoxy)nucleoside triphosphate pyrophosphohydrolase [unclassified Rathayibacter]KQQ03626.1 hypothetical protein ASF42_09015 [Rathayibacter sp. Leaf294]KQS12082.1 hypothetical protein ASG06_09015 [Rathayibacter sp. Leaf185]